jgi:hypothetical protein
MVDGRWYVPAYRPSARELDHIHCADATMLGSLVQIGIIPVLGEVRGRRRTAPCDSPAGAGGGWKPLQEALDACIRVYVLLKRRCIKERKDSALSKAILSGMTTLVWRLS